jgi:hypothetical protein
MHIKEKVPGFMASAAEDPFLMTYWHLKEEKDEMDWHEIVRQAQDFTKAFHDKLENDLDEDATVRNYFWSKIEEIVKGMKEVTCVTERGDPLLMIKRKNFTFVYFSLLKSGLHVGCWMAVPADTTKHPTPKLLCCFLHEARTQKRADWVIEDNLKDFVDCADDFDLSA